MSASTKDRRRFLQISSKNLSQSMQILQRLYNCWKQETDPYIPLHIYLTAAFRIIL